MTYRNPKYEKRAKDTPKDVRRRLYFACIWTGVMCGILASLRSGGSFKWVPLGIAVGAFFGFWGGFFTNKMIRKPLKKYSELECSVGYTQETVAEAYRVMEKKPTLINKTLVALTHTCRGEFPLAVSVLKDVDESRFTTSPYGAEIYYSQLMLAYLMSGDLDKGADTYNRGLYFMRTYMNSPVSGGYVSMALAVYEYYAGHLDTALQLLNGSDNAYMSSGYQEKEKLPMECMWAINCYWRALFLACKGMTKEALDILGRIKGAYVTDYYRKAADKLTDDITKNMKKDSEVSSESAAAANSAENAAAGETEDLFL